ncbi:copper-binding protein [Singulisphaera sp. PoT]|uniref:copper-binding protein n=1 Tax=Singulisphaera sp. PoT TaxID=3411797 RepID=UPI003BF5852D
MTRTLTPRPALRLSLALASLLFVGCRDREAAPEKGKAETKAAEHITTTTKYKLVGVVRRVDRASGQVTIAHEALPGFMGAMTMPFTLKDKSSLEDVQPGDSVEGGLVVIKEDDVVKDYELKDLVVSNPATEPPKEETPSGRGVTTPERPKRLNVGEEVPDFEMTTQDGKPLKLSELRGNVVVLTFIYTRCPLPNFCPMMDRKFGGLAEKVGAIPARADRVRLLSVSFDPEHDTPEILRKHAKVQGAHPPLWTFAVASHPELEKVTPRLGLMYGPTANEIIHNLCTVVIDADGKVARLDVGTESNKWQPSDLLGVITRLLKSEPATPAAEPVTPAKPSL